MRRHRKRVVILLVVAAAAIAGAVIVYRDWTAVPRDWRPVTPVAPGPASAGSAVASDSAGRTAPPKDLLAGEWEGQWSSESNRMGGRLTAAIELLPDGNYRASFASQTPLGIDDKSVCIFHVGERADAWTFRGEENLGLLKGGKYKYEGTVDGNDLVCTYDSTWHKGVYRMSRR